MKIWIITKINNQLLTFIFNKLFCQLEKVIIESVFDLHKIPFSIIKSTKVYNLKGKYFEQLYKKALELEQKEIKEPPLIKFIYCEHIDKDINDENYENNNSINSLNKNKDDKNNKLQDPKDKKELRKSIRRSSYEINIIDYDNNKLKKKRINSFHSSSRKRKKFKIRKIIFQINYNTQYGEDIGLLGSIKELGSWHEDKCLRLEWNEGNIWKTTININFDEINNFEFKFILIENGNIKEWENGSNRNFNHSEIKTLLEKDIKQKNKLNLNSIDMPDYSYNFYNSILILKYIWNKK